MNTDNMSHYWDEDPDHSSEDWKSAVAADDTRQGYWEWVDEQKEQEWEEALNKVD